MNSLIDELERATEGSPWLDRDIAQLVGAGVPAPDYTTSLDAALTLVPEGTKWKVGLDDDGQAWARVGGPLIYDGGTPAIALCIAALKARQAMEGAA